jgi:hypothetical protein
LGGNCGVQGAPVFAGEQKKNVESAPKHVTPQFNCDSAESTICDLEERATKLMNIKPPKQEEPKEKAAEENAQKK